MRNRFLIGIALLLLWTALGTADDVWTPEKMMTLKIPGGVAISPGGEWIAFTVTQAVMTEEKSEFLTHIWLSAADGSGYVQLVLYPRSGHGLKEPRLMVDMMNRVLGFFMEKLNP